MSLFGTDGVRGIADVDLTAELARALGWAASEAYIGSGSVVVGRDTRLSGPALESALVEGLCIGGAEVLMAGIVPTPAVSFLSLSEEARGGAVISASHNPVEYNGIKFFAAEGTKVADAVEREIEELVAAGRADEPAHTDCATVLSDAEDRYVSHLLGTIGRSLQGLKVVLDCAFGAAWSVAPRTFRDAGADVIAIHAEPDGARINVGCGSTSLGAVAGAVREHSADVGLAFDGDGDRVLAVDENGSPLSGDHIVGLAALRLKELGKLANDTVVVTVMSNLGYRRALEEQGIKVVTTPVGDRYVAQGMVDFEAVLGGEQSGHVIFREHTPTGDGILTGLKLLELVADARESLSRLAQFFMPFAQVLLNIDIPPDADFDIPEVAELVRAAEGELGEEGRVLVRPSGTEPVVRVMVEAADAGRADRIARELAEAIRARLA